MGRKSKSSAPRAIGMGAGLWGKLDGMAFWTGLDGLMDGKLYRISTSFLSSRQYILSQLFLFSDWDTD